MSRVVDSSGAYRDFEIEVFSSNLKPEDVQQKLGQGISNAETDTALVAAGHGNSRWAKIPYGANAASRYLECVCFAFTTNVVVGDGAFYVHIPAELDKMILTYVHALVITAGTTGTTDIQIANVTNGVDILSTKLTIDSTETGSNTAATAAVINPLNRIVTLNNVLRIDVDAVSTTKPKGLIVTMGFKYP